MALPSRSFHALIDGALQTLWPAVCAACDRPVADQVLFCAPCNLSINPLCGVCPGCALPMFQPDGRAAAWTLENDARLCRTCRRVPFPFAGATGGFEYGEALAEALMRMKHGGRRYLARRLARLLVQPLAEALARGRFQPSDAVVAVPLHAHKLRRRGFNQALELARWALVGLSRAPSLCPVDDLPRLERHLLHRTRPTRELGHAGPAARLAEVAGAFLVSDTARLRGRRVLLVDDVFTTGATFSECAAALLQAGAARVHVLALARAV
ncbi:MAG TPA: phosphoribosyltransferase family protein [Polyangia bacterium]|nr:phosphoribosyltransferase family protein [Polyangia bacterium]